MSRIINILPETLANKIAAGEVIQRPASAVKELVENSIDSGAKKITVIVKEGGIKLIQVIDDGNGMSTDDVAIAFERHSTSKIASLEDLENIRTLGFRGEALASIASVSQVELKTRQATSQVGTKIRIDGGLQIEISEEATPVGTSLAARNLFYNTPARRKFLKSNNTEFKHIYDVVQRVALSYPQLEMKFISDEETILDVRRASMEERIKDIFGEKLFQTLFSFDEQSEFVTLNGFLGKPQYARRGRTEQYLYLNNRYIVNRSLSHAVFQAYEHLLEKGSFPFFVLFLNIDPKRVDVNVHPSKMEVKFEDESSMYRFVLSSVRKALSAHDLVPTVEARESFTEKDFGIRLKQVSSASTQRVSSWKELLGVNKSTGEIPLKNDDVIVGKIDKAFEQKQSTVNHQTQTTNYEPRTNLLWQVHNKYIIVPIESGLMLVDQHAAHERVIYERAVARFNGAEKQSQQLLFPHTLEMTPGDAALIHQLQSLLENLGFGLKFFGKTTVILEGVPNDVKPGNEKTILQDVLDLYKEDEHSIKLEPRERLAKSYSCKAAVKAGDPLNEPEMRSLLDQLFATEIPYVCPHGRPVIVKLSLDELDKRFGRTS